MASRIPSGLGAVGQAHGGRRHQVPDIAHEQHGAAGQGEGLALGESHSRSGSSVRARRPDFSKVALVAAHDAEPVAVGLGLIGGIDGGDRSASESTMVKLVQGGFKKDVGEACRVSFAD